VRRLCAARSYLSVACLSIATDAATRDRWSILHERAGGRVAGPPWPPLLSSAAVSLGAICAVLYVPADWSDILRYLYQNAKEKSVLILDRHHVVTSPSNWVERDASRKEEIA
jgi:hypothetical protein